MGFELNKTETDEFEELKSDVSAAYFNISKAVEKYNDSREQLKFEVEKTVEKYNNALEKLREFVDKIAGKKREEWNDKSKAWQEGDRGQEINEWIEAWENKDLDSVSVPETPDAMEINFEDHGDNDLTTSP